MGQIYNKSHHPVQIKRIAVRVWGLRDEIEAALLHRIKECEALQIPLFLDDIKTHYGLNPASSLKAQENVPQLQVVPPAPEEAAAPAEAAPVEPEEIKAEATTDVLAQADEAVQSLNTEEKKEAANPFINRVFSRTAPDLDKISYGFTLLSDINMETILIFSKNSFMKGQSVVIEFLIPQSFMMSSEITICNHYGMRSRIISQTRPDYRLQARFTFQMPGERARLRDFLKSVEPDLDNTKAPAATDEAAPGADISQI